MATDVLHNKGENKKDEDNDCKKLHLYDSTGRSSMMRAGAIGKNCSALTTTWSTSRGTPASFSRR